MRLGVLALTTVMLLAGCPKKNPSVTAVDMSQDSPGGFVDIDLGEEEDALDELFGSELMMATAECGDLVQLEPAAMMGKLKDGEIRCLDGKLRTSERQTVKDKLSRVLMSDSWAKADHHRWETIVRRHLETIDRSDPDLCYKFSLHMVKKKTAEAAEETMRWADVALENRSVWTGDLHVKRVYNLYKIKAVSAQNKWAALEETYNKEPSEEALKDKDDARAEAKQLAREWLEYARVSGKDPTVAMQMCVSAAGTQNFCNDAN